MDYADYLAILGERFPDLAWDFASFHLLENVLQWMKARGLSLAAIEVITQDEYSHDFLFPLEPGGPYVVFGMT